MPVRPDVSTRRASVRILLPGAVILRLEKGKITQWSDYYDSWRSRAFRCGSLRYRLARTLICTRRSVSSKSSASIAWQLRALAEGIDIRIMRGTEI